MINKKEKGITLVSLVVTIIVMIIISTILIRTIDGMDVVTETMDEINYAYEQNKLEMEQEKENIDDKWGNIINNKAIDNEFRYDYNTRSI